MSTSSSPRRALIVACRSAVLQQTLHRSLASLHSCRCVMSCVCTAAHGSLFRACVHSLMYVRLMTLRAYTLHVFRCCVVCCSCTSVVVSLGTVSCRGPEQNPVRYMMRQQLATLQHSIDDQRASNRDLLNDLLAYRSYLSRKSKLEHAPLWSPRLSFIPVQLAWLEMLTNAMTACSGDSSRSNCGTWYAAVAALTIVPHVSCRVFAACNTCLNRMLSTKMSDVCTLTVAKTQWRPRVCFCNYIFSVHYLVFELVSCFIAFVHLLVFSYTYIRWWEPSVKHCIQEPVSWIVFTMAQLWLLCSVGRKSGFMSHC